MKYRPESRRNRPVPRTFEEQVLVRIRHKEKQQRQVFFTLMTFLIFLFSLFFITRYCREISFQQKNFQVKNLQPSDQPVIPLTDRYYFSTLKDNSHYLITTAHRQDPPNQL